MHARKHTRSSRRWARKAVLALVLTLLLGLAISGTVAYLSNTTEEVDNSFVIASVRGIIEESISDNTKTSITVYNDGTVACYIRVALIPNWVNEENQICTAHSAPAITLGSGWTQGADGYYYHTDPVKPGESTSNLLGSSLVMGQEEDGCIMQVEVLSSAIQTNADAYASWSTK